MSWSDDWEGIGHVNCLSRKDFVVPLAVKFLIKRRRWGPPQHFFLITCRVGWGEVRLKSRNALYQGMLTNYRYCPNKMGIPWWTKTRFSVAQYWGGNCSFSPSFFGCLFGEMGWLSVSFDLKPNKRVAYLFRRRVGAPLWVSGGTATVHERGQNRLQDCPEVG